MKSFKKNQGYSIIETLVAVSVLMFITMGYIKHKSDLKIHEREQYLYNEIKTNSFSYQKLILNRVKNNETINILELNEFLKNFTYENCFNNLEGYEQEFQLSFCHVINKNRNAYFNIYESDENIIFTYRPNKFNIDNGNKCELNEFCMEQVFWGLKDLDNTLITTGAN